MTQSQAKIAVALAGVMLALNIVPGTHAASAFASSGTLPGGGYVAVKVNYSGHHPLDLSMSTLGCEAGCAFGATMIAPNGSQLDSVAILWGPGGNEDCIIVRSPQAQPNEQSCHESSIQHAYFGVVDSVGGASGGAVTDELDGSKGDASGVWMLLVWIAFEPNQQSPTSWSLVFAPGEATILGVTTGDRAWYASASDFQGGSAAEVSEAGAFVSANLGSHLGLNVENHLLGVMATDAFESGTPAGGLSFLGPTGVQACTCSLWNVTGSGAVGPGAYELDLTRAAAGHQGWTDLEIAIVDPELPG